MWPSRLVSFHITTGKYLVYSFEQWIERYFSSKANPLITLIGAIIFLFLFLYAISVCHCTNPSLRLKLFGPSPWKSADVSSSDPLFLHHRGLQSILTWMCGSRFDLNGRTAPAVLLHLRHSLTGHLVGFVGGTHGDLVLDYALTFQLLTAVTARQKHRAIELQDSLLALQ